MKIFDNLNIFRNDDQVIGLKNFQVQQQMNENPKIYTGDYSMSMFKFDLDKKISPSVGQNLYFLS